MKHNLELFENSLQHKEKILDHHYSFGSFELNQEIIEKYNSLKELVITFNNISSPKERERVLNKIISVIKQKDGIISNADLMSYFHTENITKSHINFLSPKEIGNLIENFYKNRIKKYSSLSLETNATIFQVLHDKSSSKRKGKAGQEKMKFFLEKQNYSVIKNIENIENKEYSINEETILKIIGINEIKYDFGNASQNKKPDLIFKNNNLLYICEHKNISESGGSQDKQIKELIDFIKFDEKVIYASILDGIYFNKFTENKNSKKIMKQKENIKTNLEKTNNYFLNT